MTNQYKTIGILGGGQLGRMSAIAAKKLGIKTVIYSPGDNEPAAQIADNHINAPYEDADKLKEFASLVNVVSYEFENIPVNTIQTLKQWVEVYPDASLLDVSQHRGSEKDFLQKSGLPTAVCTVVSSADAIAKAINDMPGSDFILKTTRFGYDGKGQTRFSAGDDSIAKWKELNTDEIIIEQVIDFDYEISVVVARDHNGKVVLYDPALNKHEGGILKTSIVPAPIPDNIKDKAHSLTKTLAEAINLRGVLAIEFFVTKSGEVLANEIAPRTHNSGHWTIDACKVSQFENHIRTVCGMEAADPDRHSSAVMINLIGDDVLDLQKYEAMDNAIIHLYGKDDVKPGRKMAHINIINPSQEFLDSL